MKISNKLETNMQRFEKLYPLEKALQRGTLFQAPRYQL